MVLWGRPAAKGEQKQEVAVNGWSQVCPSFHSAVRVTTLSAVLGATCPAGWAVEDGIDFAPSLTTRE